MADYAISNVPRRVVYAASGTGPYAFTFEILDETDIAVYKADGLLELTTDYTVTINTNGTGEVTLVSTAGSDNITIVGAKNIQRTSDFTTGGDLFANTLNDELDNQTIFIQQVAETAERGLKAPVTDPTDIAMTLPSKVSRAGKTLAFDANGNPVVGEDIGNWRGDWASGTSYSVRDLVKDADASVYRCNTAHTSSGSTPISTNADSAKWDLVIDASAVADAEAAQAAAEAAQAAAETAETNAETAATNAASSASAASTSASSASSSASAASTSASSASSSASAASTSATNAASSASTASTQATNASNSASAASTSASNASSSASSASTSASNASTSATNAASSATAASGSASTASTQATNAANSASAAASSASTASSAADAALAALDSFDDRYLGQKTSDPTLDNDGNALVAGALYFNTTDDVMKVYEGSVWVAAYASLSGALLVTNNLSDLANAATARTNLGLAIGTNVQAYDADLTTLGAGGSSARSFLGLAIGADVQAYSAALTSYATNGVAMRNRIINGAMTLNQRGSSTTSNGYALDRWLITAIAGSKMTVSQSSDAPTGFSNSMLITSSAATTIASGDYYNIGQRIEGFNTADLMFGTANAKTVTVSFWAKSSLTGTFGGSLQNSAQNRSYPFTYTISSANTWEYKTATIAGDTTGTWIGATNGIGMQVLFGLGTGSTYQSSAGAWAGGYLFPTSAVNLLATNAATLQITGVQLEVGSSATGFEYVNYQTLLANCYRYFQYINLPNSTADSYFANFLAYSSTDVRTILRYPVPMRAAPSITFAGTINVFNSVRGQGLSGFNYDLSGPNSTLIYNNFTATGYTAGNAYLSAATAGTNSSFSISAEL